MTKLVHKLAGWLPPGWRLFLRDFIETELRGFPRGMVAHRGSQISLSLDMVLAHYRVSHPQVCFLQVGAFDGVSGDPIYPLVKKHGLRGVLVEPQPDAFDRLKANYASFDPAALVFVNAAITPQDGTSVLYRIKPGAQGPGWLHEIASFDRNVVMRHARVIPNLEALIEPVEVRGITFTTLFREAGIHRVDLLQIDTEGYDAEILRMFDVPSRKPAIIQFEHKHLTPADHGQTVGALIDLGYKFTICLENTLGYLSPDGEATGRA
jgi:FkbM family methyltransferase